MEPCFNLADEKWILVLRPDGHTEEYSLRETLLRCQDCRALGGETPAQNVAVLRFLLAVLYAALFGDQPFDTPDDALDAWFDLWEAGRFPEERIEAYLARWRDRMWLFHPDRPFMQVTRGKDGLTIGNAAEKSGLLNNKPINAIQKGSKLNGAIAESSSKERLFNIATGINKASVSIPEAARWLLYVMAYDDAGIKDYYTPNSAMNQKSEITKNAVCWVGNLCSIYAEGSSLFETLMLNLVLLKNGRLDNDGLWGRQRPTWEYEEPHIVEKVGVSMPDNPAEILSFLSRRLMLIRNKDRILGYLRYVGEAFIKENANTEQWTIWKMRKQGQTLMPVPRDEPMPAQLWREIGAIISSKENLPPGVVSWISAISNLPDSPMKKKICYFHYTKLQYDNGQHSNIIDEYDDGVSFCLGLLTEAGKPWVSLIQDTLQVINNAAEDIGEFAVITPATKHCRFRRNLNPTDDRAPEWGAQNRF